MKNILTLLPVLLLSMLLTAQSNPEATCYLKDLTAASRNHNVDFKKMILEVAFNPEESEVIGTVKYDFTPIQQRVDSLFFDAVKIHVKSIKLDGKIIQHQSTDDGVTAYFNPSLTWDQSHKLEIDYTANPRKGIYFIGWNDPENLSRKQIWTQGQGIDNRHWIPSYDHQNDKLITETIVHFSRKYEVVSNGVLAGVEDRHDGDLTWHYKMSKPHASYLVMLAIGQYDYKELQGKNGVKIRQYFYPDLPNTFEPTYQYSVEMMDWCEQEFGVPYPWETYANVPVQDFMYGAMENTTATIFTDYYIQDERAALEKNYVGTNAHELVHQWFGDYITAWSGHDHWLQESFATHYAKQFRRFAHGEDAYQWIRKAELSSTQSANKKNQIPVVHSKAGSARHYPKGSLVIDMIKYVIGKEQYDRAQTHYLKKFPYKNVDTHDFQMAFLEELGINLDWFFDQWLYRGGEPHYEVTHQIQKNKTTFYIDQTHEVNGLVGTFKMPVIFDVYYEGSSKDSERRWVNGPKDTIVISNPLSQKVSFVIFDPNSEIIKTIEYKNKTDKAWMAQALHAENMIDRHEALLALRDVPEKNKREDLLQVFQKEKFFANRAEVVRQLANDDHSKSKALLKLAAVDEDVHVRRAVIAHVDKIGKDFKLDFEKFLSDRSYVNIEKALVKLSDQFPDDKKRYLEITSGEKGHEMNIRATWLELASEDDPEKYLPELVKYSSMSYGFRTRINAMKALQNINYFDEEVLANIVDGVLSANGRLAGPSKKALKKFQSMENNLPVIDAYFESRNWKVWEKELVEKYLRPEKPITN